MAGDAVLGLVIAPGSAASSLATWERRLEGMLATAHAGVTWTVDVVIDGLVDPLSPAIELVQEARRLVLDRGWDVCVVVTDIPLRSGRRPAISMAATTHGVGIVSWPSLGPTNTGKKAPEAVARVVSELLGNENDDGPGRHRRVLQIRPRSRRAEKSADENTTQLEWTGYVRLVAGMVAANRPWRVALTLTRSVTAALATVVFAVITTDIWLLADQASVARQVALTIVAVALGATSLIVRHGLWERTWGRQKARSQVALFNLVTTMTVTLGFVVMYASLAAVSLLTGLLFIDAGVLGDILGQDRNGLSEYVALAWFTGSLATLGGAVGAGFESDEAIREAAYATRPAYSSDESVPPDLPGKSSLR